VDIFLNLALITNLPIISVEDNYSDLK